MKLFVQNTTVGLLPLYPTDLDEKRKLKIGETYEVAIRRPRNVQFHRKFFALIEVGHDNHEWYNDEGERITIPRDSYRKWAIKMAGFFNAYDTPKGTYFEPQSIAFHNMDEDQFAEVYSRVLDVIIDDLDCTAEEINEQVLSFL